MLKYFRSSIAVTIVGLIAAYFIGYYYSGTVEGGIKALFIAAILSVLELSISFDNAVVNATVLKDMTPVWQHRFLTWGMLIAVFGMRLVFPLLIVGIIGSLSPWSALVMAATRPQDYAAMMLEAHHEVSAFGGAFLLLVTLKYFFDVNKDVHWISIIEKPLVKIGKLESVEVGITIAIIMAVSRFVVPEEANSFMIAGLAGILTYLAVESIGTFLEVPEGTMANAERASIGMFLYLEVLDASFSFDGVIGAFAVTNNLFIIAVGLGIGAMFVRSLTILMVDRGTLETFKYLEHGAFYAVGALALIMFTNTVTHIPEVITGLIGGVFIGLSLWSSLAATKKSAKATS